jgi:hypothetical protein
MATCTGPNGANDPNCSLGTPGEVTTQAPENPAPQKDVGHNGKLSKLPGNNPPWFQAAKMRYQAYLVIEGFLTRFESHLKSFLVYPAWRDAKLRVTI